ncbi:hypothetical protein BJV78DRAFT_64974 [Lactifluus subvellereus]|nr:hypothetical protein BJV78DRAFT_64974 [Lactifluus subvellereus]
MSFYVSSTPSRHRARAYSLTQPVNYPYPTTPYAGYSTLGSTAYYDPPGFHGNKTYYVAPSESGRGRSHSRPRHGHSHHHSHRHHSHHRRSHSAVSHRHHRPAGYHGSRQHSVHFANLPRSHHSPTLGERILNFFGLRNSNRYTDQHGRSVDNRGRPITKY